jgi:adenosylcobinamide-GDP ribazoletransferase
MGRELRLLLVALQFLTRVPVFIPGFAACDLRDSARHFPLVGVVVGGFGASVLWAAAAMWPLPVAVVLSVAATVWLTGGLHEDGLADTCDALGGDTERDQALSIMKDSRLGSYGALGLFLTLALKLAALHALALHSLAAALAAIVLAHTASRTVPVVLMAALPYAGTLDAAKAKPMAGGVARSAIVVSIGWAVLVGVAACAAWPASAVLAALGAAAATLAWIRRRLTLRLGGYTGDTLGAAQQWSEVAVLLALLATAAHGHA